MYITIRKDDPDFVEVVISTSIDDCTGQFIDVETKLRMPVSDSFIGEDEAYFELHAEDAVILANLEKRIDG